MSIIEGTVVGSEAGFYPKEIEQSLRFNDDDSAYLSWTPASAGNRKTWTFSAWVKRGNIGSAQQILVGGNSDTDRTIIRFGSSDVIEVDDYTGVYNFRYITSAVYRDVGSWYHICVTADINNATASERIRLYVNGERITAFSTQSDPSTSINTRINNNVPQYLGKHASPSSQYLDGYLADVHFTDGTAYDATAFGEFKNGVWVAKTPDVVYGANGFYLDFADGGAIGNDVSGNNNDWTATNLASTDVMLDSPTNNFATWNPLANALGVAISEGNLKLIPPSATDKHIFSTFSMDSGKWYFEVMASSSTAVRGAILISDADHNTTGTGDNWINVAFHSGVVTTSATDNGDTSVVSINKILTCCFDADNGQAWFAVDSAPNTGSTAQVTGLPTNETYRISYRETGSPTMATVTNFGQDSSFAGNKTPQGNTDANGRGDFYYAPPAGYLALCTANLPEPAIGPNSTSTSDEHFNVLTYTNTTNVTGVGFAPDLVWHKSRNQTYSHYLYDKVRGTGAKGLNSDTTNAEGAYDGSGIVSFDSDGVTYSSDSGLSETSAVGWFWKANGSGVSNTDGSITSTVSANVDAGFSIVSWTSNQTTTTIGHGLNQAPAMIITKNRSSATNWPSWYVYHQSLGNSTRIQLNETSAATSGSSQWGNTDPTSSVFTAFSGASGDEWIAYCFAEKEGFSKFGSYTGNGSADGPFVHTGFRPAFVMVKRTDSADSWRMYDATRSTYNASTKVLYPNLSNAEDASTDHFDWLSNGFKCRSTNINASGGTYIFIAFAEMPAKYSLSR